MKNLEMNNKMFFGVYLPILLKTYYPNLVNVLTIPDRERINLMTRAFFKLKETEEYQKIVDSHSLYEIEKYVNRKLANGNKIEIYTQHGSEIQEFKLTLSNIKEGYHLCYEVRDNNTTLYLVCEKTQSYVKVDPEKPQHLYVDFLSNKWTLERGGTNKPLMALRFEILDLLSKKESFKKGDFKQDFYYIPKQEFSFIGLEEKAKRHFCFVKSSEEESSEPFNGPYNAIRDHEGEIKAVEEEKGWLNYRFEFKKTVNYKKIEKMFTENIDKGDKSKVIIDYLKVFESNTPFFDINHYQLIGYVFQGEKIFLNNAGELHRYEVDGNYEAESHIIMSLTDDDKNMISIKMKDKGRGEVGLRYDIVPDINIAQESYEPPFHHFVYSDIKNATEAQKALKREWIELQNSRIQKFQEYIASIIEMKTMLEADLEKDMNAFENKIMQDFI